MSNKNLSFSTALEACKKGKRIAREGWNGKGMFICNYNGLTALGDNEMYEPLCSWVRKNQPHKKYTNCIEVLPCLILKTADNKALFGWLASQTDLLANDWEILED